MEEVLNEHESETIVNKCESCGANYIYDIESGNLKCEHCGSVKKIENDDTVQRRAMTDEILNSRDQWNEASVYRCNGCGAKEVLDKKDITRICCFCGSSNIVAADELAGIKPDSVIPFQITKDSAIDRFKQWIKKRFWAPKAFKIADIRERMNALYCSSWSFSARTESNYNGTLGRVTVRHTSDGKTHTSVKWFRVSGNITQEYNDYTIQSGDRISHIMFNKLKPYDFKNLKVYRQEYLSGIIAEHYTRNLETCFNSFTTFVRTDLRRKIISKHNADRVQILNIQTDYKNKRFNYILLPVYICNYIYNKKTYNFYINGADGKVVGQYPKSKLKILLFAIGIGALVIGAAVGLYLAGVFN